MSFVRAIGRWTMTALVVNCIIGSGIFGLPSEVTHLVGRASPIAMIVAGLAMAVIMMCIAEVASHFDEAGGAYLYTRTAFGRFAGIQVAWFSILAAIGGGAANASLFMIYLSGFFPWAGYGWQKVALLTIVIAIPTLANYVGVRSGATFASVLTVAKLLPLVLLIVLGLNRFGHHFELLQVGEITSPGVGPWLNVLLLLVFAYGGLENALIPTGEVKEPRSTVPFGLLSGLFICIVVYTLIQFVTVAALGTTVTSRPLAQTASVLIGPGGGLLVSTAVLVSTYGWVSGGILNVPRIACSLSSQGDFPSFLGKLHHHFHTPATAILIYSALGWLLAVTGTYLWLVALTSGSMLVIYGGSCGALIRLRKIQPETAALRIPFGRILAVLAIAILAAVLTRLRAREVLLMSITALIATANWWWARRRAEAHRY